MSGNVVNLRDDEVQVDNTKDSIIIVENFESIRGGRALDVSAHLYPVIFSGHPIIKQDNVENYKPLPVNGSKIVLLGAITPGSGYSNDGTYTNVALTGGSGSTATADIVVTGGVVTSVTLKNAGINYKQGDSLSAAAANIGTNGSGFAVAVSKIGSTPSSYGSLPSGYSYVGILIASIRTKRAFAGIMVRGTVNPAATHVSLSPVLSALKTALPLVNFRQD